MAVECHNTHEIYYFDQKYPKAYFLYTNKLIIKEGLIFKKYFLNPIFVAINQERSLFKSNCYLRMYGMSLEEVFRSF